MSSSNWWSILSDECPITLEPLSELPYPPFILYSDNNSDKTSAAPKTGSQYFFDGLALATYVISQGNFANPLTRNSLTFDDCVRLDEYLNEHVYHNAESQRSLESTVLGREKISVLEAFGLRNSIKVKVGSGNGSNEAEIRRAEVLRNKAAVALRGLFVFGHNANHVDNSFTTHQATPQQQCQSSSGGFDLNYNPSTHQNNSWGIDTVIEQDGLRIIDDDEALFQSAAAVWQEIQDAFPHLPGASAPATNTLQSQQEVGMSEILQVARRTANLTLDEEREEAGRRERNRRICFLQALERKKQRIDAKRRAKETAAVSLMYEQKAKDELQTARNEIDRWRDQQWQRWEKDNLAYVEEQKQAEPASDIFTAEQSQPIELDVDSSAEAEKHAAVEKQEHARAAAKKKAKRQRAKELAKEKKKEEQQIKQAKEHAIELQKKKDSSEVKCGACGEGVIGYGFEKFGMKFCSTKCARSGPASS
ncbi:hypothetical protein ACHAWO_003096 [Cyclotella atomus]|uniref:Uncharacterized protein n=1 Tax=Cyclotella atomus TaxID=382360 RepID=A0ABD3NLL6_9STRA